MGSSRSSPDTECNHAPAPGAAAAAAMLLPGMRLVVLN